MMKTLHGILIVCVISVLALNASASQVIFIDDFNGSNGASPDPAKWFKGGTNATTLDGAGVLHMVTGATNWDPYIDTRSLFSFSGTTHAQVEMKLKFIAGLQVFGFAEASGNGNGKCFIPQPNGVNTVPAAFQVNVGPNTWSASTPTAGPYVVNDNSQFVYYRVTFDPSTTPGTVVYEISLNGTSWTNVSPASGTDIQYDKTKSWMPWIMNQGWNGGTPPGADMYVDYVKVTDLDALPVELSGFDIE